MRINDAPQTVFCIYVGFRGLDTQLVVGGLETHRHTDENSCPAGTSITGDVRAWLWAFGGLCGGEGGGQSLGRAFAAD